MNWATIGAGSMTLVMILAVAVVVLAYSLGWR